MWLSLGALAAGFMLDLLIGDPHFLYHPVRLIGALISGTEKLLRKIFPDSQGGQLMAGGFLVIIVTMVTAAVTGLILLAAGLLHPILRFIVETIMCYQILATKALKDESMKVYRKLKEGTLEESRHAVSMIVGRDTQSLDQEGIVKATVETIAENSSDGIIAPIIFLLIGGPVLGFTYKAINTMDSMVGYKNDKYLYFGRVAAKLDDLVNYIPARLAALLMIAAAAVMNFSASQAFVIWKRDRYNHASPNSAQTEAVMAGALGVQLAGDAWYFGKRYHKQTIGDQHRNVTPEDIKNANRLLYGTAVLAVCCLGIIKAGLLFILG